MIRPQIPTELANRIEDVIDDAGYASKSELIRHATLEKVEELEEKQDWWQHRDRYQSEETNEE